MNVGQSAIAAASPRFGGREAVIVALASFLGLFIVGHLMLIAGGRSTYWWSDIFWTIAALLVTVKCFIVARSLDGQMRRAWLFFGFACGLWLLGILSWSYMELVQGRIAPFPTLSDAAFLLFAPLFAIGMLFYRIEAPSMQMSLLNFSQLGIFFACLVAIHIVLFYHPIILLEESHIYLITALAFPVFYMSLLVQALASLWLQVQGTARRPLAYIVAGLAVHSAVNSLYAYALLDKSYVTGSYLDVFWLLGFALIYYGAVEQQLIAPSVNEQTPPKGVYTRALRMGALLPPTALLMTLAVFVAFRDRLEPDMVNMLLPVGFSLIVFVALREWSSNALEEKLILEIQRSEERLRQVAWLAPVGIFRIDANGYLQYCNERCSELLGLNPDESLGLVWETAIHEEDRERIAMEWWDAVHHGRPFRAEYRFRHPGGRIVWVLGMAAAERDSQGRCITYIGSLTDITARKETEQALVDSEEKFRTVFASSPVMVAVMRIRDGCLVDVNDAFVAKTGWPREEILGRRVEELGLWANPAERETVLSEAAKTESRGIDWRLQTRSGAIRHMLGSVQIVSLGGEPCYVAVAQDITERTYAEHQMHKLSRALEQTADAIMVTDRAGFIEYVNPAFVDMTGYTADEVVGRRPNILKSDRHGDEFYQRLWTTILDGGVFSEVFINRKKDGDLYYEEKSITPLRDGDGVITHFVGTGRDITGRMETQKRLQFLAYHDILTELPNRSLFLDRLNYAIAYARWHERLVAVLFLDLDRFKYINDTLGHDVGDAILREMSARLGRCLRERDTIARFGGDEFVILLDDVAAAADVGVLAHKILDNMRPSVEVNGASLHVTASIGISLYPHDGDDSSSLLRHADTAMYRAKEMGRDNFQFYSSEMSVRALERLTMENSLRKALEQDQFVLYYQPQFDMRDGSIVGLEALIRWQHPDLGLICPADFIPLLEETGLIVPVGQWVLNTACIQLGKWRSAYRPDLRMAVNVSGRQFQDPGFIGFVEELSQRHGLTDHALELEITESTLMHQGLDTASTLNTLNQAGLRLGLDDFGTGYSSLSYLRRFPIDTLKIDRTFVRDIPDASDDSAIVRAIIVMGQSLRLDLIAEGVETEGQRDFLGSLGCHVMQGYLFSPPLPAGALTDLLRSSGEPV